MCWILSEGFRQSLTVRSKGTIAQSAGSIESVRLSSYVPGE